MKITAIRVYRALLPIAGGGYAWANGKSIADADCTIVCLETDAGIAGWGETTPLGAFYLPSYPEGVRSGVRELAPHLIGCDPTRIGSINRLMDFRLRGHDYAKSAIDVACWDILGKQAGLPVHALLGGRQMDAMPMYWSVSQAEPDEMRAIVARRRQQGYRQFQIKVGTGVAIDIARIRAVAGEVRDDERLLVDANTGWRRDDALRVAQATSGFSYYLEQPCDRYEDCLSVRRRVPQPIKLDESLQSVADVQQALADDAMDIACIKISKLGGLTKSKLARDLCAANGIAMTVEDVWGSDIVTAALAHLAVSTPPEALLNTTDLHNYHDDHIATGAPTIEGGSLFVSDRPGLGVEPDPSALGEPVAVYD